MIKKPLFFKGFTIWNFSKFWVNDNYFWVKITFS